MWRGNGLSLVKVAFCFHYKYLFLALYSSDIRKTCSAWKLPYLPWGQKTMFLQIWRTRKGHLFKHTRISLVDIQSLLSLTFLLSSFSPFLFLYRNKSACLLNSATVYILLYTSSTVTFSIHVYCVLRDIGHLYNYCLGLLPYFYICLIFFCFVLLSKWMLVLLLILPVLFLTWLLL